MNKLIKLFNDRYYKIDYPKSKLEFYYTYLFLQNKINEYNDNELKELLSLLSIPEPSTLKELDIYRECVDFIGNIRISKNGNRTINFYDKDFISLGYHIVEESDNVLRYRIGDKNE